MHGLILICLVDATVGRYGLRRLRLDCRLIWFDRFHFGCCANNNNNNSNIRSNKIDRMYVRLTVLWMVISMQLVLHSYTHYNVWHNCTYIHTCIHECLLLYIYITECRTLNQCSFNLMISCSFHYKCPITYTDLSNINRCVIYITVVIAFVIAYNLTITNCPIPTKWFILFLNTDFIIYLLILHIQ